MRKTEKSYQLLTNSNKQTVVYYDEFGIEEFRENYNNGDNIRNGYISFHLTMDVPSLYVTMSNEIKKLYLDTIVDENNITEDNFLTNNGKEVLKNKIRNEYSEKISNIENLKESVERFIFDGTQIPQTVLDNRELLKTEYHSLITYLGL